MATPRAGSSEAKGKRRSSTPSDVPAHLKFQSGDTKLEADSLFQTSYYQPSYRLPYNPDPLVYPTDYSTYDEMRRDDQVKVCLSLKKDMVLNSGWKVVCDDDEPAEFFTDMLESVGASGTEPTLAEALRDVLSAFDYGFSLSEAIHRSPAQSQSGKWELAALKVRPPHSFIFHTAPDGTVTEIEQLGTVKKNTRLKPSAFLHYVYQQEFGIPYGTSDLQAAFKAWKAKKFVFRMAMRHSEKFASPTIIAKYPDGAGTNEISQLRSVVDSVQNGTSIVVPQSAQVDFKESQKDGSALYEGLLNWLNLVIGRALLVPDLLGVSGSKTDGGSFSLGQEHFDIFLNSIKNERKTLERKITRNLLEPLARVNFGDKVKVQFVFLPMEARENTDHLKLWLEAVNGKALPATPKAVNHFERKVGFPETPEADIETQQEEAKVLEAERVKLENDNLAAKTGSEKVKASGSADTKADPKEEPVPKKLSLKTFREVTRFEEKMDFSALADAMARNDETLTDEILLIANRMVADLVDQANKKGIVGDVRPEKLADLKPKFQRDMNDVVRGNLITLFREAVRLARKELKQARFADDGLTVEEFENIIRAESFKLVGDITSDILKRTSNKLLSGLKSGQPLNKIVLAIREEMEDKAESHIATTVRTKTTEVMNAGRKLEFDKYDFVVGYQWSSVLDNRTTEVCRFLDQKAFSKADDPFIARLGPPAHFNCRSVLVPITAPEVEDGTITFSHPPSIERLKDMGGNLIFKKFQMFPNLQAAGECGAFGSTPLLAAPGPGRRLRVKALQATVKDNEKPVVVGYRAGEGDAQFPSNLSPFANRVAVVPLPQDGWLLPENSALSIHLSASVNVGYSCDYQVEDLDGGRLA